MVPFAIISLLLFLFNNNISCGECKVSSSSTKNQLVPALYVFGDSLVDCGNNNWLNTTSANYLPYGIDFYFPPKPTGRVTNGRTLADIFCEYLALPIVPPYYEEPKPEGWLTGYNYASGSCGILSDTGIGECSTLEQQVSNFKKTIDEELAPNMDEKKLRQYLSQSIFLIIIGSNDYLVNYFPAFNSNETDTPDEYQFAELLINNLSDKLKELYELGVRKAVVSGVPALGCLPQTRLDVGCNETKNEMALIYNNKLDVLMNNFSATYPDSLFTQAHIYDLSYDAFFNPTKYGLTNSRDACCRLYGDTGACLPTLLGGRACPNRTEYYFWDGYHPTEAFNIIVANQCISGLSTCLPFNFQELVQLQHNLSPPLLSSA